MRCGNPVEWLSSNFQVPRPAGNLPSRFSRFWATMAPGAEKDCGEDAKR